MPGTTLTYNGVQLVNVETLDFNEELVYEETNTDPIYHRFTLRVRGHIHGFAAGIHGTIPFQSLNPSATWQQLNAQLMEPRKSFRMETNGGVLLLALPFGTVLLDDRDVNNGPKPKNLRITRIIGEKVLEIEYAIEICLVRCESLSNPSGILSNRWSCGDVYDENWFLVRTWKGRLRVASTNINPQKLRGWIFPPIPRGLKRVHIECTTAADGLTMDYLVIDRQVVNAAPYPATSWSVVHQVDVTQGIHTDINCGVSLQAPPGVDKRSLITLAAGIVKDRLSYEFSGQNGIIVNNVSIIDYIEEHANRVDLTISIRRTDGQAINIASLDASNIGTEISTIPGYDRYAARVPATFPAVSPTGILVSYLQSPCNDSHRIEQGTAAVLTSEIRTNVSDITPQTYSQNQLPPYPTNYSEEHKQAAYTFAQVDNHYIGVPHRIQMAVAASYANLSQATSKVINILPGPVGRRIVRVRAERVGAQPRIPIPRDFTDENGIDHRLLDFKIVPSAPELTPDNSKYNQVVDCEYVYAMERAIKTTDKLRAGSLPWDNTTVASNLIQPNQLYSTGIA